MLMQCDGEVQVFAKLFAFYTLQCMIYSR